MVPSGGGGVRRTHMVLGLGLSRGPEFITSKLLKYILEKINVRGPGLVLYKGQVKA